MHCLKTGSAKLLMLVLTSLQENATSDLHEIGFFAIPHYRLFIDQSMTRNNVFNNREFKIFDATVAKTSLKIASSSFSIYFAIMSVRLTFESSRNYPGSEFRGAVSTLEKNIQICA